MLVFAFDTETTGLPNTRLPANNRTQPRVVQIAGILFDDITGERQHELSTVIKPEGFVIPEEVAKLHGVSQERAMREGKPMREVFPVFLELVRQADVVVAHNIQFDKFLMEVEAVRYGLREPLWNGKALYCTMKQSTDIVKLPPTEKMKAAKMFGYKQPNLTELHQFFFGVGFDGAHDALVDVEACIRCYMKIIEHKKPQKEIAV